MQRLYPKIERSMSMIIMGPHMWCVYMGVMQDYFERRECAAVRYLNVFCVHRWFHYKTGVNLKNNDTYSLRFYDRGKLAYGFTLPVELETYAKVWGGPLTHCWNAPIHWLYILHQWGVGRSNMLWYYAWFDFGDYVFWINPVLSGP